MKEKSFMKGDNANSNNNAPHNAEGHRERLMKEFEANSALLEDYRLLELLLFYAIPRIDTRGIAVQLLERFGSIDGVLAAEPEMLQQIKGVGAHTAKFIKFVATETDLRNCRSKGDSPRYINEIDIYEMFKERLSDYKEPMVCFAAFNGEQRLTAVEEFPAPDSSSFCVPIQQITEFTTRTRAVYFAYAHNRISGLPKEMNRNNMSTIYRIMTETLKVRDQLALLNIGYKCHYYIIDDLNETTPKWW